MSVFLSSLLDKDDEAFCAIIEHGLREICRLSDVQIERFFSKWQSFIDSETKQFYCEPALVYVMYEYLPQEFREKLASDCQLDWVVTELRHAVEQGDIGACFDGNFDWRAAKGRVDSAFNHILASGDFGDSELYRPAYARRGAKEK